MPPFARLHDEVNHPSQALSLRSHTSTYISCSAIHGKTQNTYHQRIPTTQHAITLSAPTNQPSFHSVNPVLLQKARFNSPQTTDQTTDMTSAPTPPQWQGIIASSMKPEDRTVSLEHQLAQSNGHVLEGSESSTDSFVSAQESTGSGGTQQGGMSLINKLVHLENCMRKIERLHGLESAAFENEINLERDKLRRLEGVITSEREKSQSLESEIILKRDNLRESEDSMREIALDCDKLRGELDVSRRQLEAARRNSATLEHQVQDLHLKMTEGAKHLRRQVVDLTARVRDHESRYAQNYRNGVLHGMQSLPFTDEKGSTDERVQLLHELEAYKADVAKWKMEAHRQGSETISRCWQASVDEAVRREREKDVFVMKVLRDELAVLKSKTEG